VFDGEGNFSLRTFSRLTKTEPSGSLSKKIIIMVPNSHANVKSKI